MRALDEHDEHGGLNLLEVLVDVDKLGAQVAAGAHVMVAVVAHGPTRMVCLSARSGVQ